MNHPKTITLPATLVVGMACQIAGAALPVQKSAVGVPTYPLREAYYGDLHLHTSYSFDAYLPQTAADPVAAYRFARGEVIEYLGQPAQRREPLDFLAIADHAESLGVFSRLGDSQGTVAQSEIGQSLKDYFASSNSSGRRNAPPSIPDMFRGWPSAKLALPEALRYESASAWQRQIEYANRYYEPGKFTTFIAYEWTAQPAAQIHRNVIFKTDRAPLPFTAVDSQRPEDLWAWLERIRDEGFEALAIPHNGNTSNGLMYDWVDGDGKPLDAAYAEKRRANEPLSEISQKRGASEANPLLSPNDEFASHEIFEGVGTVLSHPAGSYLRDALGRGLILQRQLGVNPYQDGFVGGSDLHGGLSVSAQADFGGNTYAANVGGGRSTREEAEWMLSRRDAWGERNLKMNSGSLTGVWAESNTREAIYDALRRRETFATSGTRLKFRFFGGWDFEKGLFRQRKGNWVEVAYARGVPMGSDLPAKPRAARAPSFAIWAVKDPNGANLDRVQIIKVWEEDGQQREKVFDVAWSGHRELDAKTGKLSAVGDTVDLKTGRYTNDIGAVDLRTIWNDPEFDPRRHAAYYLRVLEVPTPRWSTLLAIQMGLPLPKDVPATIQQRGWSSPIWYVAQAD